MNKATDNARWSTDRLDVYCQTIVRNQLHGSCPRLVYSAWLRFEDVPWPICTAVVFDLGEDRYLDRITTDEQHRRRGYATEMLRSIEASIGLLAMDGVTESGIGFVSAYLAFRTGGVL